MLIGAIGRGPGYNAVMPSIYQLKPAFQNLLRPLVRTLAAAGVTANQVTISAFLLSCAGGLALVWQPSARWPWLLLPALLFVRMALNAVDGMLAREFGQKSRLGAFLNELGDVLSDSVLILPLALLSAQPWLPVMVALLAVVSEMTGVLGLMVGSTRRYDGPLGKSDRAFVLGAVGLLLGLGVAPGQWLDAVWAVMCLLLLLTIANRMRQALREGE